MRSIFLSHWLFGLMVCGGGCLPPAFGDESKSAAAIKVPDNVIFCPDLTYRTLEKRHLQLDLAHPQGEGPFPAVVILHGCEPLTKGRKANLPLVFDLAQKGYVAVTVSYRASPKDHFPAPLHDVQNAIRWLRAHATQFNLDSGRIAAVGYSAGGTLACLLGLTNPSDGLEEDGPHKNQPSKVQAVVNFYGPTDFGKLHEAYSLTKGEFGFIKNYMRGNLEEFFGGPPTKVPKTYALASPLTHLRKNSAPLLDLRGLKDKIVPPGQGIAFYEKAQALGANVRHVIFDGAEHDLDKCPRISRMAMLLLQDFLDENLKTKR